MSNLYQPILGTEPEPSHSPKDVLKLEQFIALLKEEEDYYEGEQTNTKLMITRLRKIFYDQWGWNSELIRGATKIEGRYEVKIVDTSHPLEGRRIPRYKNNTYTPKKRLVVYTDHDKVYGSSRAGQVPFIYKNDHQELLLPEGYLCDIAHVLAGLDAYNYPQVVSPLPSFLSFLNFLAPHVDDNIDVVTWLGDIASSSGDFMFDYLKSDKTPLSEEKEQNYINIDAPASDMLGDIDPYVIARNYAVGSNNGMRVTEIFEDYYYQNIVRSTRFITFCEAVGLKNWNGAAFENEKKWLKHYKKQLRDNVTFQVFSLTEEKLSSIWLPLKIWFNCYQDVLKLDLLLEIFLKALKECLIKEQ